MKSLGLGILCAIVLLSGCGGGSSTGTSNPPPSSGSTSISAITGPNHLQIGVKSANFAYSSTVSGNSNTAVTWSVDAPTLATIDANTGVATPSTSKTGTVTITATSQADPNAKSTLKVQVVDWILEATLNVILINADGSAHTELLPYTASLGHCSWAPDHLGFVCVYFDPNAALGTQLACFKTDGTPAGTTQTATVDLKALGGIIAAIYPSFSPDGKKIAFYGLGTAAGNVVWGTFVVDADGKSAPMLLATDPSNMDFQSGPPRFSPDGKTILFTHDWGLWSMNADGTNQQQLAGNAMNGILSPGQDTLFFTGYDLVVYKANPDGTNAVPIGIPGDELTGISPNGNALVVENRIFPVSAGLYTENDDGSGRKEILGGGWASW